MCAYILGEAVICVVVITDVNTVVVVRIVRSGVVAMERIKVMDRNGVMRDEVNVSSRRSAGILVFEFLGLIVVNGWRCWSWRCVAALLLITSAEDLVDFGA